MPIDSRSPVYPVELAKVASVLICTEARVDLESNRRRLTSRGRHIKRSILVQAVRIFLELNN